MSGKKIIEGLKSALAYAKGDRSKGQATSYRVRSIPIPDGTYNFSSSDGKIKITNCTFRGCTMQVAEKVPTEEGR